MQNKFVLLGRFLNFLTLTFGLVAGFFAGVGYSGRVHAQQTSPPIEEVTPLITAGSAAFGTVLATRLAVDEISVRGFDPIKFDENLLNLLNSKPLLFNRVELETLVNQSKSDKIFRMKQPESPKPPTPEKKP